MSALQPGPLSFSFGGRGKPAAYVEPSPAALASAATLVRLNSLLVLMPLTSKRRELVTGPLTTHEGRVFNYSQLYADVAARGAVPPTLLNPTTIRSGDVVRTSSGYRGVSKHFALWLKKGMRPPGDMPLLAPANESSAMGDAEGPSVADGVVLTSDEIRALKAVTDDAEASGQYEDYGDKITAILTKGNYSAELIRAVLEGKVTIESLFWTTPTEACPVLLSPTGVASTLDPLDASQSLAATHDLYLFAHPDEMGYFESFASSLAPNKYLATDDSQTCIIDPLLAHAQSRNGHLIRWLKRGAMADKAAFPGQMFGLYDENSDGLEWHAVAEQVSMLCYNASLEEARALIAEHLLWLESRLQQSFPAVAAQLQLQSSELDNQRVNDAPLRALMSHLQPIPVEARIEGDEADLFYDKQDLFYDNEGDGDLVDAGGEGEDDENEEDDE